MALPILPYRDPKILSDITEIPKELLALNKTNVLLVTDEFLHKSGATKELEETLEQSGINCVIYDKTRPNPTVSNVEEARALYLENNCQALVAFGGGSAMDCAKAVGARVAYPKKSLGQLKGILHVRRKIPTLFAIPTTAGTGSEITLAAVITDDKTRNKYPINSFPLIPRYAVLDPKVTYSLPKHLTSTTGIDALTHAVEAYIGRSTTKETRKKALEATALIYKNIEIAYSNPTDYEARKNMLYAAFLAGGAFSKSYVGYIHAVAHSLGGEYNIPHGLANSVLMPIVLESYGKSAYKKLHRLGIAAGVCREDDSHKDGAEKFILSIKELNSRMGIGEVLEGIKKEDISRLSRNADKEANPLYPVPRLMGAKDLEQFYYKVADWSKQ